ncbi:PDZ domain-containing protein [Pseudomonas putida]|uniref:PDZ domain-containing protein n=1 Tax=Pseudomonas putida TaxID=303 RepID=UPI0024E0AB06|nr:PDZ domain-containing protein [Pseudomonas putida]HDS0963376.1 PDZ domain-containing protein [Pseudomonas putida]HDS0993590.1 PDZ domain-containing protein [Pseudomonas putida]
MKMNKSMERVTTVTLATVLGTSCTLLSGCVLDPISLITDPIMYAADAAGPTDAEIQAEHDAYMKNTFITEYRGETCEQITMFWPERKEAVAKDNTQWGGKIALDAAEQVIREKGCVVPDTPVAAASASVPTPTPAATVERDPASFSAVIASPPEGWGSVSKTGRNQTSLAQWVARENPQKYQGRSCDYLQQALARSQQLEASSSVPAQAVGASQRVAVRQVLDSRNCPVWTANGSGRTGAYISAVDPIKAPQLNMPGQGASVEGLVPGGNAERAGLQFTDVVVGVGSTPVNDDVEFLVAIGKMPTGSTAVLKVWRKTAFIDVPVQVGPPLAPPVAAAPKSSSTTPAVMTSPLDMQLGSVTHDYAKAVGLQEPKGAWVIETAKGGTAERAGIKPLDVILEVSGQEVTSPDDFTAIGSKMRKGYNAPIVVWRDRAKKDLKMVLN